jgi:hypothetical protein
MVIYDQSPRYVHPEASQIVLALTSMASHVQTPLREAQDPQSIRDDDKGKHPTEKVDSEDVDVALWRQPHGPPSRPYFPDVSSASIAAQKSGRSRIHSKVNLGSGVVENSPAPEQPIQDTVWPLDDM